MRVYSVIVSLFLLANTVCLLAPSDDPWYQAPQGFEDAEVGTVLRNRSIPSPLRASLNAKVQNTWQLLVRSTDSFGNPNAIVTTLIEPFNADPSKVVTYNFAEDSAGVNCAVSYEIQSEAPTFPSLNVQAEFAMVLMLLDQGWYVNAPDMEGPKAALLVGKQAGHAVLDSIRAVLSSDQISSNASTVLYGYSGGSFTTGWTVLLQPSYAPELKDNLIGAAMGGFLDNMTASLEKCDGTAFAGLIPLTLSGWMHEYPSLQGVVYNNSVSVSKRNYFMKSNQMCLPTAIATYPFMKFFSGEGRFFRHGWDFFQLPVVKEIDLENILALNKSYGVPDIPIFVFQSQNDEVVPISGPNRVFKNWCEWGVKSFEYAVDLDNGHITEALNGGLAAFAWIKDRFDGEDPVQGCNRTVSTNNRYYKDANRYLLEFLKAFAESVFL